MTARPDYKSLDAAAALVDAQIRAKPAQAAQHPVSEPPAWMDEPPSDLETSASKPRAARKIEEAGPIPLPADLMPVEPLPMKALPDALHPWIADVSERMQCPPDFVAVPMLIGAASLVARRIAIRPQGRTEWTEKANLWALVVGRPGMMKSPAMSAALAPLERLEAKAAEEFFGAVEAHTADLRIHKMRTEATEKLARQKIAKDPTADLSGAFDGLDELPAPVRQRLIVNDLTYEAMGDILASNPDGILSVRDEMRGLLLSLAREENANARAFYLQAWSGGRYTFDRITRGSQTIPDVRLSMIGCIQPGPLSAFIRGASVGGSMDDGMVQRFLMCWPDQSGEWRNVDRYPDSAAKREAYNVFDRLHALRATDTAAIQETDFNGEPDGLPFLRFDPAALEAFEDWRSGLEARLRGPDIDAATEGALSKFRKHVPALALTLHVIDGNSGPVSLQSTVRALALADYFESHAKRAYASGVRPVVGAAKSIMKRVQAGALPAMFTARDVHQRGWSGLTDREVVGEALDMLATHRQLIEIEEAPGAKGGRPKVAFTVNDRVTA